MPPRTKSSSQPPTEAPPARRIVSYPSNVWLERLKEELVAAGIDHDRASLVSRRVLSALIPQEKKLEAVDRRDF